MDDQEVEHEICGNCKKEIPQQNYVMHSAHCARNITLCKQCKEPVPKSQFEDHKKTCKPKPLPKLKSPEVPKSVLENSPYFQSRKAVEDKKQAERRSRYLERHEKLCGTEYSLKNESSKYSQRSSESPVKSLPRQSLSKTFSQEDSSSKHTFLKSSSSLHNASRPSVGSGSSNSVLKNTDSNRHSSNATGALKKTEVDRSKNGTIPKYGASLLACRFCDLELPKMELEEHENYCGSRTDKCLDCGELVMYKHKQVHMDTNHGFLKLNDEPGPKASWDSSTQRPINSTGNISPPRRRRFDPTIYTDFSQFDPTDYLPSNYRIPKPKIEKGESYKEISRRLDCKTEYIRNVLHDSASITVPLRQNGTVPRNHFNHNKGPAPQPPSRRRNPPTQLCIPCEFCDTPIPHEDLIQHETGCRPDLARLNIRSRRRPSLDDEEPAPPQRSSDEVELPCEFCSGLIPASQLYSHQSTCE